MLRPAFTWHIGQAVHRPAAFLLGEKLDGKVRQLLTGDLTRSNVAWVSWSDGTRTEEPLIDLTAGAFPARKLSWLQRVKAMFAR